jgi:predicted lactoylglutathione lyase
MNRMIFVNLPVSDLPTSQAFYSDLGFSVQEQFTDESCACIVVSEQIFVMLLVKERFADFVVGEVADAASVTEVINCLTAESRQEVDQLVERALAAGGKPWKAKMSDGPLYGHSFADPDGHAWEILHMDLAPPGAASLTRPVASR